MGKRTDALKKTMEDIKENMWKTLTVYPGYSVGVGRECYRTNSSEGDAACVGGYLGFLEGLGLGIGLGMLRTALTKTGGFPYDILIGVAALRAITAVYGYNLEKAGHKPQ